MPTPPAEEPPGEEGGENGCDHRRRQREDRQAQTVAGPEDHDGLCSASWSTLRSARRRTLPVM